MTRDEAYTLLGKYMQNKNLLKHSLACEAAMKEIYRHLTPTKQQNKQDEDTWGITGLLHDIDYEIAQKENKLDQHGMLFFNKEPDVIPEDIAHAIKAHNYYGTNVMPDNNMDWTIACVDALTGLIVATALIHPEKKLAPLTVEFVMKRFQEKSFARGARREDIQKCEEKLKIPLSTFISITLDSMKDIHETLDL